MRADALYVVVTPTGHIHQTPAFDLGLATRGYVREWVPREVSISDYVADSLWRAFADSGYTVHKIDLPKPLDGKKVCRT